MADTGNLANITFPGGFTGNFHMIGSTEQEVEDIETSYLQTTDNKTYIVGDLAEPGEFEVEFEFKGDEGLPALKDAGTFTVTGPVPPGLTNGATLAGTGYVKKISYPEYRNNQLQMGKATIKWDGETGPVFTAAT